MDARWLRQGPHDCAPSACDRGAGEIETCGANWIGGRMMRDLNKTKSRAVRVHSMFSDADGCRCRPAARRRCGMPKNATLTEAREAYRSASADPRVVRAPGRAKAQSLREAEASWAGWRNRYGRASGLPGPAARQYCAEKGLQAKADECCNRPARAKRRRGRQGERGRGCTAAGGEGQQGEADPDAKAACRTDEADRSRHGADAMCLDTGRQNWRVRCDHRSTCSEPAPARRFCRGPYRQRGFGGTAQPRSAPIGTLALMNRGISNTASWSRG